MVLGNSDLLSIDLYLRRWLRSNSLCKIGENDDRGIANVGIVAGKFEFTTFVIFLKNRDVVSSLIAAVKKPTGRIEVEATGIISSRPFLSNKGKVAVLPNGKDPNAVVQSVACVYKFPIR